MFWIYILLIIIAIGVLLLSESGKKILKFVLSSLVTIIIIMVCLLVLLLIGWLIYYLYDKYQENFIFLIGAILFALIISGIAKLIESTKWYKKTIQKNSKNNISNQKKRYSKKEKLIIYMLVVVIVATVVISCLFL